MISEISNLTDARYFAAWGVDWIGFNVDFLYDNTKERDGIREIMEWVEGPKFLAEFRQRHEISYVMDIINDLPFVGVLCNHESFQSTPIHSEKIKVFDHGDSLFDVESDIHIGTINNLEHIKNGKRFLNPIGLKTQELLETVRLKTIDGIVLKGGVEEKIGFKSFDELDEIFEALELD